MGIFQIAVDGPAGSGKTTISKIIASRCNIEYVDTGAMYRAVTLKALQNSVDINSESQIERMLISTEIDFLNNSIYLDGKIVNEEIRKQDVTDSVSMVSSYRSVRKKLVEIQRKMSERKSIIMDGRDIGTVVLPNAKYKYYLVATPEVRGLRRYNELLEKGVKNISLDMIIKDIERRDLFDSTREIDPLIKAADALEIDTSNMSIEEVANFIILHSEDLSSVL